MKENLKQFTSLFENFPNLSILHVNNNVDFLIPVVEDIVNSSSGKLEYQSFIDEKSLILNPKARDYEYIVLSNILDSCKNIKDLLKMYYLALENSANLIILVQKNSPKIEEIKSMLVETNYLVPNNFDIFDDYTIITAKKFHMWA